MLKRIIALLVLVQICTFSGENSLLGQELNLRELSKCLVSGYYYKLITQGDYAYIATGYGFKIIDINDPVDPQEITHIPTNGLTKNLGLVGDLLITCDEQGGVSDYDISDRENPVYLSTLNTQGEARAVIGYENYIYVASENEGVQIIDISDPYDMELVNFLNTSDEANALAILDHWLYVAIGQAGVAVYDVTDAEDPQYMSTWNSLGGNARSLYIFPDEQHLALADHLNGVHILHLIVPSMPTLAATIAEPTMIAGDVNGEENFGILTFVNSGLRSFTNNGNVLDSLNVPYCVTVTVANDYAYVCKGVKGYEVESCLNPQDLYNVSTIPDSGTVAVISSVGNIVYVATKEGGLAILDISDPWDPVLVNRISTGGMTMGAMVLPGGEYLYATEFSEGIKIYDLTDPINPQLINTISQEPDTGAGGTFIKSGYLYLTLWNGSMQVYDLADPASPVLVNSMTISPYLGGVEFSADGSYLYAICGIEGLKIYHIVAPDSIVYDYTSTIFDELRDFRIHGNYAYVADFASGMFVCDVSDPEYIFKVDSLSTPYNVCQVHIINDNYLAMCQWTEGFSIVDISDPMEVEEVIYQDTPATAWCAIWDGTFLYICDQYDLIIYDLFDNAGIKNAGNESVPGKYALLKSIAPNPFNSSIKINYEIPHSGRVKLAIYNIFGEEVEVLLNKNCSPGEYSQDFVGGEFSSGIYFVSLQFDGVRQMQKVVMVK